MIRVRIDRRHRVVASARVVVPLPRERVAAEMARLRSFVTHDLFHAKLTARHTDADGEPIPCSRVRIEHRLLGVRIVRVGRLLWRDPRRGFGFTDLSRRHPARRFPHACHYRLHPLGPDASAVTLLVVGTWTLRPLPRPLARAYLTLVLGLSAAAMRNHLLRVARWRRGASGETL